MSIGVIISATGSPVKADYKEIKIFLKNFLSDKRVIKIPKAVLYFILLLRPLKIKKHYEKILINGEMPLNFYLKEIKEKLEKELKGIKIEIGNLYSKPYLRETITKFLNSGLNKIYLLPLYPQESPATTGTTKFYFERIKNELNFEGFVFPAYWSNPLYLDIMREKIEKALKNQKFEYLIFSYHGLPQKMEGSFKYREQCFKTTDLILNGLNFEKENIKTSFQSRFGFFKWLKPYTKEILINLRKNKIKKIAIVSPSFPIDCLETLYEIKIKLKEFFVKNDGEELIYIEALNSSVEHIEFLKKYIKDNL